MTSSGEGVPGSPEPELDADPRTPAFAGLAAVAWASRALAQVSAPASVPGALAQAIVPAVADVCLLYLQDAGGALRPASPAGEATDSLARLLAHEHGLPAGVPTYAGLVAQGRPLLVADVTEDALAPLAESAAHLDLLRAIGYRSLLAAPLAPRAAPAGLLLLGLTDARRRYDAADTPLGEVLAALVQAHLDACERAVREAALRAQLDGLVQASRELAHLLNNDLTMPVGAVELLLDRGGLGDEVEEMLTAASRDLANLETHVRTFQQLVRSQVASTAPVAPNRP